MSDGFGCGASTAKNVRGNVVDVMHDSVGLSGGAASYVYRTSVTGSALLYGCGPRALVMLQGCQEDEG